MYTDFYNLKEKPFNLNPSSRFLYLGETHKEALAILSYGVAERKGFTLLTGEVGTGKTTMVHALLAGLDKNTQYVHLSNPLLSVKDFFSYIAASVFNKIRFETKAEFLIAFENYLKTCLQHQKNFILIIDEAHKLSFELLEEIRLLSNMESADEKLLNIFLVGQPELNEKLTNPNCRALLQRISTRYHIRPLDSEATREYLQKRLQLAGAKDGYKIFTKNVIKAIHAYSKGYPRMINILADNVLLLGYSKGTKKILPSMVKECYGDLQLDTSLPKRPLADLEGTHSGEEKDPMARKNWKWAAVLFLLIAICGAAIIQYGEHMFSRFSGFAPFSLKTQEDKILNERLLAKESIEQKIQEISNDH